MREYIVDVNIIFSAVIRQSEMYERLLDHCIFYTPDFALSELQKYRQVILKKTRQKPNGLRVFTIQFFKRLVVLPDFLISDDSLNKAEELCADVDPKDAVYVALAIELNIPLVTRDKPLFDGLQAKGFSLILQFDSLVRELLNQ